MSQSRQLRERQKYKQSEWAANLDGWRVSLRDRCAELTRDARLKLLATRRLAATRVAEHPNDVEFNDSTHDDNNSGWNENGGCRSTAADCATAIANRNASRSAFEEQGVALRELIESELDADDLTREERAQLIAMVEESLFEELRDEDLDHCEYLNAEKQALSQLIDENDAILELGEHAVLCPVCNRRFLSLRANSIVCADSSDCLRLPAKHELALVNLRESLTLICEQHRSSTCARGTPKFHNDADAGTLVAQCRECGFSARVPI